MPCACCCVVLCVLCVIVVCVSRVCSCVCVFFLRACCLLVVRLMELCWAVLLLVAVTMFVAVSDTAVVVVVLANCVQGLLVC